MEETDVGRLFAAVAPETVPTVGGLPERARALGHRQRRRRAVMSGGGTALALAGVVGAVVTLGGFGSGSGQPAPASAGPGRQSNAGPGPGVAAVTPSPPPSPSATPFTLTPSPLKSPPPGFEQPTDDPVADAHVLAAIKAALPAADRDKPMLERAAETAKTGYGAEYSWGPRSQEMTFSASVARLSTVSGTPSMCQADAKHCSSGAATLHGNPVTWEYYNGSLSSPGLNVYDQKAKVNYYFSVTGPDATHFPGLAELKDIALNDQVASALLAAWPQH
jgi:hypothetical protein